jgi:hypothetical protein
MMDWSEDGEEVFAITCAEQFDEYVTTYRFVTVNALKKRGEWAEMLIHFHGRIQEASNKGSAEFKYYGAEKVKERFKE